MVHLSRAIKARNILPALLLCLAPSVGQATPFTFQFDLPAYDFNTAPAEFGTSAVVDVTVNNGAANDISQNYAFSNITGLSATTVGGTFSGSWTSGFNSNVPSTIFLTTNGSGIPTLDLLGQALAGMGNYVDSATASSQIQFAVPTDLGSSYYTPFSLQDYLDGQVAGINTASTCGPNKNGGCGFEVVGALAGTGPTGVPEPLTLGLFGTGLGTLFLLRRRVNRQVS